MPLGEFGTLRVNANGAAVGRTRSSDEINRGWSSTVPRRASGHRVDIDRRSNTTHVASVATRRRIASVDDDEHRDYTNCYSTSRGRRPETVMKSADRARRVAFHGERRQPRPTSALDQSRDYRPLPVYQDEATWRRPETVYADDSGAGARWRPQSAGGVSLSVNVRETGERTECRRAARDVRNPVYDCNVAQRCRLANDCRKELRPCRQTDGSADSKRTTASADVAADALVEVNDREPAQIGQKMENADVFPVADEQSVGEGGKITGRDVVSVGSSRSSAENNTYWPPADHAVSGSQPRDLTSSDAEPRRPLSAAEVVATSKQIWWPCSQESGDEESANEDADDRSADKTDIAAADAADDDTGKTTSWTGIDASVEESIRELDRFLLQQDSDAS